MVMNRFHVVEPLDVRLKILVVEDNDLLRELFRTALRGRHAVFTAACVKDAWHSYKVHQPDIVFVDIRLPDGSGHELTRKIKEENPSAYVVVATVNDYIEEKEEAARNHADGFIAKPYNMLEINDCIERCREIKQRV